MEKDISTIVQYAPVLVPFETVPIKFSEKTATQILYLERGYPSYLFIRLEWDPREEDEGFIPRSSIQSIQFRLFGQECQYTSKLTEDELYHICHKNCHKYCGFQQLWENENALVLTLEDIGLITEKAGYPRRKRLELELKVTWLQNAKMKEALAEDEAITNERLLRLRTVCIYENRIFMGDIRRSEFVDKYV